MISLPLPSCISQLFFYTIDSYAKNFQNLFYLNPVFVYITYFRRIVIEGSIPGIYVHGLCALYALMALLIGGFIYRKYNYRFLYYV